MMFNSFRKSLAGVVVVSALLTTACKQEAFKKSENGLQYQLIESKGGKKPEIGQVLRLHLAYRNEAGKEIYNSAVLGDSFMIELTKPTFTGGLEEGFAMMGEGDSAAFLVLADSVFEKLFHMAMPETIHAGEMLRFDVRLKKIVSPEEMRTFLMSPEDRQRQTEIDRIESFMKANNLRANPARPGVYMLNFKEGQGKQPKRGDEVSVKYIARELSGKVYDATEFNKGELQFVLGKDDYLPVFVDAILSMKEGGLSRLILSSDNAYGAAQFGPIPPNTPLVFDIELLKVHAGKPLAGK